MYRPAAAAALIRAPARSVIIKSLIYWARGAGEFFACLARFSIRFAPININLLLSSV